MHRRTQQKVDELSERKSDVLRMLSKWSSPSNNNQHESAQLQKQEFSIEDCCPIAPPLEEFMGFSPESSKKIRSMRFFADLRKGDVIYGTVSSKLLSGIVIKLVACDWSGMDRSIDDLGIKGSHRSFINNSLILCFL
jgi:hypothetical protein